MPAPDTIAATVLGYPPDTVTAIGTILLAAGTVALAVPTIFLAVAAWKQLPLLRAQLETLSDQLVAARAAEEAENQRQALSRLEDDWRAIEANTVRGCERYFTNPVVYAATRAVYAAAQNGKVYDRKVMEPIEHDLITVLNYLNALAVGVEEDIYSGDIIKDHLHNTIVKVVDTLIPALITTPVKWQPLLNLRNNWKVSNPSYRRGPRLTGS